MGCGTVKVSITLPKKGMSTVTLHDTYHTPIAVMSIISISRLDKCDDIYSLFGNGKNVTFRLDDKGTLMDKTLETWDVVLTGTKHTDRVYYLDTPCQTAEVVNAITTKNPSRLE